MSRFQFVLVVVAALFMVGCVLVPPTLAAAVDYEICTEPGTPQTLNVTGLDYIVSQQSLAPAAQTLTINARTDREIRSGSITIMEYFTPTVIGSYDLCSKSPCPIARGDFVIGLDFGPGQPILAGHHLSLQILDQDRYGPCISFVIPFQGLGDQMLKLAAN